MLVAFPWLLVLGLAAVVLLQTGTSALDIVRYGAYWCLGLTLPGLLVVRATVGTRGNWPEDVAFGAVTGLALELACFVIWSVLGLQEQLWLWPLLVMGVFAAVPRLRRHWRISSARPLPRLWSWGVASALAACIVRVRQSDMAAPLPPAGGLYYLDVPWHLSIVHELTRSFPPQISQVVGENLRYHWFSHIHLAAAHLVSGAPEAAVVLRLWVLPLLAVTALVGARLAMELSGRWWSGPVAAWGLVAFHGTDLLPYPACPSCSLTMGLPQSPSHVFVVPLFLGVAILVVRALRGIRLGAGWVVLAMLLVAAAGAKPTAMPLVLAGTCLAGLSLLVLRRRQWRAAMSIAAMVAVILPVSMMAVAGSAGRSKLSLFDFVEWIPFYHWLTGEGRHPSAGPFLPEGVADLSARSLVILAILLTVQLIPNVGRLVPFVLAASAPLRKDPAAWFMTGAVLGGWGVFLVLAHPALSQGYFRLLADAVAAVFGAWALAVAIPSIAGGGRRVGVVLAGGAFIGAAAVTLGRLVTPALPSGQEGFAQEGGLAATVASFATPVVLVCAVTVAGLAIWAVVRRRVAGLRGWGPGLVLAAFVLGGPAYGAAEVVRSGLVNIVADRADRAVPEGVRLRLSPGSAAAMAWVDRHTPPDAVLATNRHCVTGLERPRCPAVAFWVSGLGGRRTVLEGWSYTSAATWMGAPSPFPERLAVNDAVFTNPSTQNIDRLRRQYGASWLVADYSAGPISPQLPRYAISRFSTADITVYELR